MSELTNLLSNLDLEHCKDILLENGIELLQDVAQLTADDLEGLGLDATDAATLASSLSGGGNGSERRSSVSERRSSRLAREQLEHACRGEHKPTGKPNPPVKRRRRPRPTIA